VAATLVALTALLCTGCLGARKDTRRHFTLAVSKAGSGQVAWPGALRVQDLEVSRQQDRQEVLVRKSDVELSYAADRLWAERPQRLVTDIVFDHLQRARLFAGVRRQLAEPAPKWVLGGRLDALELVVEGERWVAHLALRLYVRSVETGEVRWRWGFDERRAAAKPEHAEGARALSQLMNKALAAALASLRKAAPAADAKGS